MRIKKRHLLDESVDGIEAVEQCVRARRRTRRETPSHRTCTIARSDAGASRRRSDSRPPP